MVAPKSASKTIFKFSLCPKIYLSGFTEIAPSDFNLENSGESCIFKRIYIETPTSTIENKNGIRQPHALNFAIETVGSVSKLWRVNKITLNETNKPSVSVV